MFENSEMEQDLVISGGGSSIDSNPNFFKMSILHKTTQQKLMQLNIKAFTRLILLSLHHYETEFLTEVIFSFS